jgi:RHS repeat-associated protein
LGSPIRLIGENVDTPMAYDEFGVPLVGAVQNVSQPFGFTGYTTEDVTGFYYAQARVYSPNNSRFISEDTHWNPGNMIFGDEPYNRVIPSISAIRQGMNLYSYCMGNPLLYIDRDGCAAQEYGSWGYNPHTNPWDNGFTSSFATDYGRPLPVMNRALPPTGEPNTTGELLNPDGSVKQERVYGPDGRPIRDRDYNHGGEGHTFPHDHEWDWSRNPPRQPGVPVPNPNDATQKTDWGQIALGGGLVLLGGLGYAASTLGLLFTKGASGFGYKPSNAAIAVGLALIFAHSVNTECPE